MPNLIVVGQTGAERLKREKFDPMGLTPKWGFSNSKRFVLGQ